MQIVNRNYFKNWIFSFTTQVLPETSNIKNWLNWLMYWAEILKTWLPKIAVLRGVLCCWHVSEGENGLRRGHWLLVMSSQSSRWREMLLYLPWGRKREPRMQLEPLEPHTQTWHAASAVGRSQVTHWQWRTWNSFGSTFQLGRAVWLGWLLPAAEPAGMLFSKNTSWRAGIYSSWIWKSSWGWERLSSSFCERALALLWCCWAWLPPPANLSPSTGLKFHSRERIRLNSKWAVLSFYLVSFPFNDLKNANNALKSKHCFMGWKCPFPFIYLL